MTATVGASHVICAIGNGTDQVWAAARAGIARIGTSHVVDRFQDPIPMGLVPDEHLPTLPPEIERLPLPPRARRLLRLAASSFRAVTANLRGPVAVFVGLPPVWGRRSGWMNHLPSYLQMLGGVPVDVARSAVVAQGRAAALIALERALALLREDPSADVIVGGADTYFDLRLLASLEAEQRIMGSRVMDGFIPGEGAAFYRLEAAAPARGKVVVHGAASVMDPGHRYGTAPARGEGLADAVALVRRQVPGLAPIGTTFAGFNGEHFEAKLWGVARLRHRDLFAPQMVVEHPADKYGDTGAAAGAMLVALAVKALADGTRQGPALVWAASDREPRACALFGVSDN